MLSTDDNHPRRLSVSHQTPDTVTFSDGPYREITSDTWLNLDAML